LKQVNGMVKRKYHTGKGSELFTTKRLPMAPTGLAYMNKKWLRYHLFFSGPHSWGPRLYLFEGAKGYWAIILVFRSLRGKNKFIAFKRIFKPEYWYDLLSPEIEDETEKVEVASLAEASTTWYKILFFARCPDCGAYFVDDLFGPYRITRKLERIKGMSMRDAIRRAGIIPVKLE